MHFTFKTLNYIVEKDETFQDGFGGVYRFGRLLAALT